MNITKENLNNLINNLKKPLVIGITSLNSLLQSGDFQLIELPVSYNDIINIIGNGNLPIIKLTMELETGITEMYYPIFSYGFSSTKNEYYISTISPLRFSSDTQTGNLTYYLQN